MKIKIKILFLLLFFCAACSNPPVEKPKELVEEKKMIDMLVDIHLAEAAYNHLRNRDSLVERSNSENFYYSILNKYQTPDSVFEKSFIFYASRPRKFEKMYRQTMNKLNEMEQEYSGRNVELQKLELQKKKE